MQGPARPVRPADVVRGVRRAPAEHLCQQRRHVDEGVVVHEEVPLGLRRDWDRCCVVCETRSRRLLKEATSLKTVPTSSLSDAVSETTARPPGTACAAPPAHPGPAAPRARAPASPLGLRLRIVFFSRVEADPRKTPSSLRTTSLTTRERRRGVAGLLRAHGRLLDHELDAELIGVRRRLVGEGHDVLHVPQPRPLLGVKPGAEVPGARPSRCERCAAMRAVLE